MQSINEHVFVTSGPSRVTFGELIEVSQRQRSARKRAALPSYHLTSKQHLTYVEEWGKSGKGKGAAKGAGTGKGKGKGGEQQ